MAVMAKISTKKPTSRKGLPPTIDEASNNLEVKQPQTVVKKDLNFKVASDFKTEFKTFAAKRGISMVDLLYQMFEEYKTSQG